MIGLDTIILARYYIQDEADTEVEKQHKSARKLIESVKPLMVCKTVLLELEWAMRGYYQFTSPEVSAVFQHLLSLEHIMIEDRKAIQQAIANFELGFDFADSVHHSSYKDCTTSSSTLC